jgi:hypothetical protein
VGSAGVSIPNKVGVVELDAWGPLGWPAWSSDGLPCGFEELHSAAVSVAGFVGPGAFMLVDADCLCEPCGGSLPFRGDAG